MGERRRRIRSQFLWRVVLLLALFSASDGTKVTGDLHYT